MAKTKERPVTTGKTLREIADERAVLDQWLLEQEGELTPELAALLADHEGDAREKIEAVGWYIAEEEEDIEKIKRLEAQLAARRQAKTNRIDWLKNRYLAEMLVKLNYGPGDAVKGALATVRVQLNNPRLDGEGPNTDALIDWQGRDDLAKYVRYTPEQYALDRKAFLADASLDPELLALGGMKIVRDESVRVAVGRAKADA